MYQLVFQNGYTLIQAIKLTNYNGGMFSYNGGGSKYLNFYMGGDNKMRWETYAGNSIRSNTTIPLNTWVIVVGTFSGVNSDGASGTAKFYVNGVLDQSGTLSSQAVVNTKMTIGNHSGYMNGAVGATMFYNRELRLNEIQEYYNFFASRYGLTPIACIPAVGGTATDDQSSTGQISNTTDAEANLNSGSSAIVSPTIIDYSNCPPDNPYSDYYDYQPCYPNIMPVHTAAQSFKTSSNVTLKGIKIDVANVVNSGSYNLRIFQGEGDSGTELIHQTVSISNSGTNTFLLYTTLALTAGQSYTFKLETSDNNAQFYWTNSSDSDYSNGSGYVDGNNNSKDFNFKLVYQNNVNWQNITVSGYTGRIQKWQMATDTNFSSPIDIASTSATLASNLVGDIYQTTYFRAVIVGCSTVFSDYVTISVNNSITWTGANSTTWSDPGNWSANSVPIASSDVIIAAATNQPELANSIAIHSLTIDSGASLTVPSELNLTVTNSIHNSGTLTIENNANLIQVVDVANTGNAIVKRNSSALLLSDYTLWSSPVTSQNLFAFSPLTLSKRFYEYNSTFGTNGAYSTVENLNTTNFAVGKGYLIRMPNNANATTPAAYSGVFTGVLNNGDVPVSLTSGDASHSYNLVGNPYPSPISISTFLEDNTSSIEKTLYFWRKTNGGTGSAYCTLNNGVFTTNSNINSVDPNGIIQTGQGFFVVAKPSATSLTFKNRQRIANTANQFFKTKQAETPSRIWLNVTNATGSFSQMAINYTQNATLGLDNFDGKYINDNPIALTSNINNEEYTIQGRPTFDPSDVVALNFKTDLASNYTIALDHSDGIFAQGQDIYLIDSKTGTETNLKTDAYTFAATGGIENTRFSLKYQKTLKVDAPAFNENTVTVYKNKGTLIVKSTVNAIDSIKIFDLNGRLIAEQKKVNANTATIENCRAEDQVLIVQVTSDDKKIVNKKVIN